MEQNKKLYFSLFSGELYLVNADETAELDAFQVPLLKYPNKNCKKCHGRFHEGFNLTYKHYMMCTKCLKKCADINSVFFKAKKRKI